MLQWTMMGQPGAAPAVPTTSLEIVRRAYASGSRIIGWYEEQALKTRSPRELARIDGTRELAARIEEVIGGPLIAVDVSSKMARASAWSVFRAVLPAAMPRESDHRLARFDGRRLAAALKRAGADAHREPHPFG